MATPLPATPPAPLRGPLDALWQFKLRLQFTGWLQYIPNAIGILGLTAAAGLAALLDAPPPLVSALWVLTAALAALLAFDLLTVKARLRPWDRKPEPLDDLDAFDLMRARRSCRSFQTRKLSEEDRTELLAEAARQTEPSQLLGDSPIRLEYIAAPLTVWPVVGAHEFLVAITPKAYDRTAITDVGRSLQKVVHHATRHGLATCWIGPGADHASIVGQLGSCFEGERDHIICVCAVGYRSVYKPALLRLIQRVQGRRLPIGELFAATPDGRTPLDPEAQPFAPFGRCFEVCQWAPSSFNGQTTRAAAQVTDGRVSRLDFFAATQSRYYAPVALGIWLANWELGTEALGLGGRWAVLPAERRDANPGEALAHYDISWLRDATR